MRKHVIQAFAGLAAAFSLSTGAAKAQFWMEPADPYSNGQPSYPEYQPSRPRPAPKIPHTGSWSSWENGKPVSGNEKFSDLPSCYNTLANLAVKLNYDVHLTCENDKGTVVLYQVCKPADGGVECYSKLGRSPY